MPHLGLQGFREDKNVKIKSNIPIFFFVFKYVTKKY